MACYHPLKGFKLGVNPKTGKDIIRVTSYETDHVEKRADGKYYNVTDSGVSAFAVPYRDFVDVPCGRCIGCRLTRSKQWADRAVLELQYHSQSYHLIITYDDDHVPTSEFISKDTGEIGESLTLCKTDLQKFWKRLRKSLPEDKKIKYLACGEYGEKTLRPHYHAIVFGLEIPDLRFYGKSESGFPIYESEYLDGIWKNGKVWIGEATWESIAYVARYVSKKLYGAAAEYYTTFNIVPEFLVCSRRPGIGRTYYEDHKDELFENSRYFFPKYNNIGSACPSRYFSTLFEVDYGSELNEKRKDALKRQFEARKYAKLENTSLNYIDYLETEEYNTKQRVKSLHRSEI